MISLHLVPRSLATLRVGVLTIVACSSQVTFVSADDPATVMAHIELNAFRVEDLGYTSFSAVLNPDTVRLVVGDTAFFSVVVATRKSELVRGSVSVTSSDSSVLRPAPPTKGRENPFVAGRSGVVRVTARTVGGRTTTGEPLVAHRAVRVLGRPPCRDVHDRVDPRAAQLRDCS